MSTAVNEVVPPVAEVASATGSATQSPTEMSGAVFDDMGLRVGDRMQLARHSSLRAEPCMVRLIGYVRELSLIVSAPPAGSLQPAVIEGDNVVMRVFSGRSAFGFMCRVDRVIRLPFEYLHLSFPRTIASRVIRRSRRVKCDIPVMVDGGPGPIRISNLSSTGAEICSNAAFGEPGTTVRLAFTISVHDTQTALDVKAVIRSVRARAGDGKTSWRAGVEFAQLSAEAGAALRNLVYQELIERPQSLL